MDFDPAVSLRILHNERLRRAGHWCDYVDLHGALVCTSDAPIADVNHLETFSTDRRHLEALLDIGFSLLRAYDRSPAVLLTPLDRPDGIEQVLRQRRMREVERTVAMTLRADAGAGAPPAPAVDVRVATAEDVLTVRDIVAPAAAPVWMRRMLRAAIIGSMSEPWHTFYLGSLDGQAAGTLHLLREGATAGIYALATLRARRRCGVATALLARAIADARGAGCDVIALRTAADSAARRLSGRVGFEVAHEQVLWAAG
ncbi:MAG: GNAT family N-acetyltransferase [Dehalococcoidia bacterium]|nr:GNAT family N-acetyltransferase [Dehalococcoidia bacterium]